MQTSANDSTNVRLLLTETAFSERKLTDFDHNPGSFNEKASLGFEWGDESVMFKPGKMSFKVKMEHARLEVE